MVVNVVIRTVPAAVDKTQDMVPVSVVPRSSLAPVFDCLWREKMETEGLGTRVQVPVVTRSSDRWKHNLRTNRTGLFYWCQNSHQRCVVEIFGIPSTNSTPTAMYV